MSEASIERPGGIAMDTLTPERELSSPSFDGVREIVTRELAPLSTRIDLDGFYPEEVLRHLGAAGVFDRHVSGGRGTGSIWDAVQSMALVAEECLSTAFCVWCQDACAWYLETTDNHALRERWLPAVASGRQLGGTALSNPMKAFSGIEKIRLNGRRARGGFRVTGQVPFVSNLGPGHVFGAIFRCEDGRHVLALLDTDMESLRAEQRAEFCALDGTRTWAISLRDVFVPDERIVADPVERALPKIRPGFILLQTGLAIGLVRDCIAIIDQAGRALRPVNAYLPEQSAELAEWLARLEGEAEALSATPFETDADYTRAVLQLRLDAAEYSLKAAHAAMLHLGARGYLKAARAQRRLREAYFVAILTPATKHLRKELAALSA
jgi:alkylation response protein AidB-like acyl-CoA dehydrogenase